MEKEKIVFSVGGEFIAREDCCLIQKTPIYDKNTHEVIGENEEIQANFYPELVDQTEYIGYNARTVYRFRFWQNGKSSEPIEYRTKDILGQFPTQNAGAEYIIEPNRGATNAVRRCMQLQCSKAPKRIVYEKIGFSEVRGERVFLNKGCSITANGFTDEYTVAPPDSMQGYKFTSERHPERFNTLLELFPTIAPESFVFASWAYMFLTPLNALLREGIGEPCFILYVNGITGSYKSTLTKILMNAYGEFHYDTPAPANFRDTANSVLMKLATADSMLFLLDDKIPNLSKYEAARVEQIEQGVLRAVGDKAARGRLDSEMRERKTPRPVCNVMITAEEAYSNVGESGIARSIAVTLTPPTKERLANIYAMQDRAEHLNECMGDYIQFVLQHWEELQEELKPLFREYVLEANNNGHARIATAVAHLQIGIYTMCKWLESVEVITHEHTTKMLVKSWDIFTALAEEQSQRITEETPVKLFLNAVKTMIQHGSISVHEVDNGITLGNAIAFKDSNYYYFNPEQIFVKVKEFYAAQGLNYPVSLKTLDSHLLNDKLEEPEINKSTGRVNPHKSKRINGKQARYMWIYAKALEEKEEV